MQPWPLLKHLFEADDGSLPDVFVENLLEEEVVLLYNWLMNQCTAPADATVWNRDLGLDVPIATVPDAANAVVCGTIDSFRHGLIGLSFDGLQLPQLSVWLAPNEISLDYRMGPHWNEQTFTAFFGLLRKMQSLAPRARVFQADEGCYGSPNEEFSETFLLFASRSDA